MTDSNTDGEPIVAAEADEMIYQNQDRKYKVPNQSILEATEERKERESEDEEEEEEEEKEVQIDQTVAGNRIETN